MSTKKHFRTIQLERSGNIYHLFSMRAAAWANLKLALQRCTSIVINDPITSKEGRHLTRAASEINKVLESWDASTEEAKKVWDEVFEEIKENG